MPEELWMEIRDTEQEAVIKIIPKKKQCKKTKCLFKAALQIAEKSRENQETPGITGKFGLRVENEAGQRLIEFCQENTLVIANILFHSTREDSKHGYQQMVNTKVRLIILFAAKDREALYSQQK